MYIKNISEKTTAMVNTKVGKICVRPGEVICLNEKIFPPLPRSLRQATEEEYLSFRRQDKEVKEEVEEQIEESNSGSDQSDNLENTINDTDLKIKAIDALKTELSQTTMTQEGLDNAIEKVSQDIKDEGTIDFIKSLFKFNLMEDKDVVVEETPEPEQSIVVEEKESLKLQQTTNETQKELIQKQIDDLKESWKKAKQARKKEKIQKQIQELQKQIDKL